MSRMKKQILLVGSIPGDDAAAAMRICGEGVGAYLDCLPDGETGTRRIWINYLAATTYHGNPALETINRPAPVDPKHAGEWRRPGEDSAPRGYDDHWQFRLRSGIDAVHFEDLGYASAAKASYPDFCALRDTGTIPQATRFMVAIPLIESGIRPFLTDPGDFDRMWAAYEDALRREVMTLTDCIPANDLVVQWDICMEPLAVEAGDRHEQLFPWKPDGDAFERYVKAVTVASSLVPPNTLLGLHLCYGDLGHRHFIEPPDLGVVTRMANAATHAVARTIDYYHIPVPRDRTDDAYFEPLQDFQLGAGKLYIGLVHVTGGVDTSMALLETAKRHASAFGVATECGFGRWPREGMPELLAIHRSIADAL
jgi:hypothetical protein